MLSRPSLAAANKILCCPDLGPDLFPGVQHEGRGDLSQLKGMDAHADAVLQRIKEGS